MNTIHSIYENMWNSSIKRFREDDFEIDPLIHDPEDSRRGVTLLARIDGKTADAIEAFLQEGAALEPGQYYYDRSDLHITILSIITCYRGFSLDRFDRNGHEELIERSLKGVGELRVQFRGITASPSCVLVQGYPLGAQIERIRQNLREAYGDSDLERSIDSRYLLKSVHGTAIRFSEPLKDYRKFVRYLEKYRSFSFGEQRVDALELVYNDWYQRKENTVPLSAFELR